MRNANSRIDGNNDSPGTGLGGRLLDILRRQGFHTSANEVDGKSIFNQGSSYDNNPSWDIALDPIYEMDQRSTIGPEMFDIVKALNGNGKTGNSLYGETFSARTAQTIFEYEFNLEMKELMDSGELDMDHYPYGSELNNKFRATAQYMKSRHERKVNREVYVVRESGFDHHSEGVKVTNAQFEDANDALQSFMEELKREKLWDDTVIILGSEFGRSITSNNSGGTDHAWGGNYFMIGGGLDGGKILGKFPEYLSDEDSQWIKRGIMIPSTPVRNVFSLFHSFCILFGTYLFLLYAYHSGNQYGMGYPTGWEFAAMIISIMSCQIEPTLTNAKCLRMRTSSLLVEFLIQVVN